MTPKSRATAIVASLVVPGLGHFYLGALGRGAVFLAIATALPFVFGVVIPAATLGMMIGGFVVCFVVPRVGAAADTLLVPRERHRSLGSGAIGALALGGLVLVQVSIFGLRGLVMEAFKVPAGSMMPTLLVGDHFFVDKAVYRHRDPLRGELVVFKYPEHPNQDFVKRAVGVGGDRIEVRGDQLVINGWDVPRCEVGKWSYSDSHEGTQHDGTLFIEYLDDAMYYVFLDADALSVTYQGPYYVRPGETFVMGDNRNNSHDSRMWYAGAGAGVPRDHLKGSPRLLWQSSTPGRAGTDLGQLGAPPSPALAERVNRCVAERPPRAKTSPPSSPAPGR